MIQDPMPVIPEAEHGLRRAALSKNMVVSIDIPIFNTPWGGLRVGDGFVITESGAERLDSTPYKICR